MLFNTSLAVKEKMSIHNGVKHVYLHEKDFFDILSMYSFSMKYDISKEPGGYITDHKQIE